MGDWWNTVCLQGGDAMFGWALRLSPDAALCVLGGVSAVLLLIARRLLTDQDLLRRIGHDKRILRRRTREAKRNRDEARSRQLSELIVAVNRKSLQQEVLPLAVAVPPLICFATWGIERLHYEAPQPGQIMTISLQAPASRIGQLTHMVPNATLQVANGWIQRIEAAEVEGQPVGMASWQVSVLTAGTRPSSEFRLGQTTIQHNGDEQLEQVHPGDITTRTHLAEWRPFQILPGLPAIGIAPWMVGYVLIVVSAFYLGKRILRIR